MDEERREVYEKKAKFLKVFEYEKTKKEESAGESDEETTSKKRKGGKDQKKPAKKTKKKDPNAPKRPLTSFIIFSQDHREEITNELMRTASVEEQSKIVTLVAQELGAGWKNLSADEKKQYEDKASAARVAYKKEMAEYERGRKSSVIASSEDEELEANDEIVCINEGFDSSDSLFSDSEEISYDTLLKRQVETIPQSHSEYSFKDAAFEVLKQAGVCLSAKEIAKRILDRGLARSTSKTLDRTVAALIYSEIQKRGSSSPFILASKGMFGLRDFSVNLLSSSILTPNPLSITKDQKISICEKLSLDLSTLENILQPIEEDKQVIFIGDYGSGKTYTAKTIIEVLTNGDSTRYDLVQFSRTTSYEDFIEGIQPSTQQNDRLLYSIEKGTLLRICETAKQNPTISHFLLIDEMNRGDVLSIFGELLYALDRNNTLPVTLKHSKTPFLLPSNLYIICTMNSVDVSIVKLDNAIYRRFPIIDFNHDINIFESWVNKNYPKLEYDYDIRYLLHFKRVIQNYLQEYHEGLPFSLFMYSISNVNDAKEKNRLLNDKLDYIWKVKVFPYLRRNWIYSKEKELQNWNTWQKAIQQLKGIEKSV